MTRILIAVAVIALPTACTQAPEPPAISFVAVPEGGPEVDFARLEHTMPLTPADRATITPDNLTALSQEEVDQVYARLTAGPIPDVAFDGALFFPRGEDDSRFAEVVGGGVAGGLKRMAAEVGVARIESLGAQLWRGKVFDRDTRILRNRIADLRTLDLVLDEAEEDQIDALRDDELGQYLIFPAKLYCGQSLLDGRRESIIIDYAYTDELPGYIESLDHLVGREGLKIRDEIRMVRPGFYLGRAYMDRAFVLNFTLYNEEIAAAEGPEFLASGDVEEDCWAGEQVVSAAAP